MASTETPIEIAKRYLDQYRMACEHASAAYPPRMPDLSQSEQVATARAVIELSEPNIARLAAIAERARIVAAIRGTAGIPAWVADWIAKGCSDDGPK